VRSKKRKNGERRTDGGREQCVALEEAIAKDLNHLPNDWAARQ